MNSSPFAGLKLFWQQVLTPQGRYLIVFQLALCAGRLLLVGGPLPPWFVDLPSSAFKASSAGIEVALLVAYLLQWCAWSELLYSLRLTYQPTETNQGSPWRRFALHIYGGFVFLFVLSGLATLQPLLGIGAMFLLFMCGEAQEKKLAGRPIPIALLKGMVRSYRLISHEPWQFLASLLLPGMVLYAAGVFLVWIRLEGVHAIVISGLLALWLGFFLLAQLRVALRAEGELDVDVLMGEESGHHPHPASSSSPALKALLTPFNALCNGLATVLALAIGGWLLIKLGDSGLLSTHALGMAFSAMIRLLSGTVSASLSLLVKLGFISVVVGVIAIFLMLIIGFGRRDPLKPLQQVTGRLQGALQRLAAAFSDLSFARGATLGLGTLLTALGTVAVQTYDRVQKDQERQNIVRDTLQRQQQKEEEATQARLQRNEGLVSRIQQRVGEIRREVAPAVREQLLSQLLSDLRDVLPELKTLKGGVDGERKGKLLRYLYESGLLDPMSSGSDCFKKLNREQIELPTKEVRDILKEACKSALFLHTMDFSGASLEGAYLKAAFLPFINLKDANLRGAKLREITLRYANLENTDLSGADLTSANLADSTLVGANLTNSWSADGNPPEINGAVAFYAVYQPPKDKDKRNLINPVISWDLAKGEKPGDGMGSFWSFCPLDPQSTIPKTQDFKKVAQAGSKCRNRRFEPQTHSDLATRFVDRDWSGSSFQQSTLKGMTFKRIILAGANLSGAIFEDMVFQEVSFAGANLQDAVFRESVLDNVDFTGANLNGFRIEKARHLHNPLYKGSLVNLDENTTFSPYRKNVLRHQVYDSRLFSEQNIDDVSLFRQNFLAPLLISPLPLRPQQLLYWMLSYPLPGTTPATDIRP